MELVAGLFTLGLAFLVFAAAFKSKRADPVPRWIASDTAESMTAFTILVLGSIGIALLIKAIVPDS